jgi:hypothetical protein
LPLRNPAHTSMPRLMASGAKVARNRHGVDVDDLRRWDRGADPGLGVVDGRGDVDGVVVRPDFATPIARFAPSAVPTALVLSSLAIGPFFPPPTDRPGGRQPASDRVPAGNAVPTWSTSHSRAGVGGAVASC